MCSEWRVPGATVVAGSFWSSRLGWGTCATPSSVRGKLSGLEDVGVGQYAAVATLELRVVWRRGRDLRAGWRSPPFLRVSRRATAMPSRGFRPARAPNPILLPEERTARRERDSSSSQARPPTGADRKNRACEPARSLLFSLLPFLALSFLPSCHSTFRPRGFLSLCPSAAPQPFSQWSSARSVTAATIIDHRRFLAASQGMGRQKVEKSRGISVVG